MYLHTAHIARGVNTHHFHAGFRWDSVPRLLAVGVPEP